MDKIKVLIVDDERGFTDMVKLNLEATGRFEVVIENDSTQALKTTIKHKPDIMLVDVIMPEKEGPDVVFQIRNHPSVRHIPIIFLTATITRDEAAAQAGNLGGHVFLAKPSPVEELLACIDRELKRQQC